MDSFIELEEFIQLFRPLTLEESETFEFKANVVSDTLRQEAKTLNKDLDLMLEKKEVYPFVLKEVCATILARWITQPTDYPTIDPSVDSFDVSSNFYQTSSMGITILRKDLKRLGLMKQSINVLGGVNNG